MTMQIEELYAKKCYCGICLVSEIIQDIDLVATKNILKLQLSISTLHIISDKTNFEYFMTVGIFCIKDSVKHCQGYL